MAKRGLWANIHAKRKRIKAGSGERMRKKGEKGDGFRKKWKDEFYANKDEFDYLIGSMMRFKKNIFLYTYVNFLMRKPSIFNHKYKKVPYNFIKVTQ